MIFHAPDIIKALDELVEPTTRGDPESPLRWTCKSTRRLAVELQRAGYRIADRKVADLLHKMQYSLQGNAKTIEGTQHPDRNAQFEYINAQAKAFQRRGQPVISVDTKKKELVGNYKNGGREWYPHKFLNNKRSDHSILRVFCDMNPGTFDWLEAHGVRFWDSISGGGAMDSLHQRHPYHNVRWEKEGPGRLARRGGETTSGAGVIKPLEAFARSKGVKILPEHKMTRIIRQGGNSGRVLGVEANADNKKLFFRAKKAVILGTGSWKGNRFLRGLFDSRIKDVQGTGVPFVNPDGSGIIAGLEAGAILISDRANDSALFRRMFGTKHYQFPLNSPYGAPGLEMAGSRWGDFIFVNKGGKRFFKEQDVASYGSYSMFDAFFAQEGHVLWTIFDDTAVKKHKWNLAPPQTEKGCAFTAPTLVELAKLIQVPGDALQDTVQKYNSYVAEGKDPEFDKPKNLLRSKIETPPFSAAWVSLYVHDTCGGLAVNEKAQILDVHGNAIPGLYGGGETVGGIEFVGMNRGIILGRIAGENAAAESPA